MEKDVEFYVKLLDEKQKDAVRKIISNYGFDYVSYEDRDGALIFLGTQKDYEIIFRTKLIKDESGKKILNRTSAGYSENIKTKIPGRLEEMVESIHLKRNRRRLPIIISDE